MKLRINPLGVISEISGKPQQQSLRDEVGHSLQEATSDSDLKGPHTLGCIERRRNCKRRQLKHTEAERGKTLGEMMKSG